MKIYHGWKKTNLKGRRAVAIGIFDGVHLAHQKILREVVRQAKQKRLRSVVVTFDPHPDTVLKHKKETPIILSLEHRLRFFSELGLDDALVIRFDRAFSRVSREFFLKNILLKKLGAAAVVVGHDFRFGRFGAGDVDYLKTESAPLDFSLKAVPAIKFKGRIVSSTTIRHLIETGKLKEAAQMLGRPVSVYGTVVHGRSRGKSLGFPTANLNPHHETLPPDGVYSAWGEWKGRKLKGVIHIGRRPTFGERAKTLEVHFLNFKGNLYGQNVELQFVRKLREIKRFRSPEALSLAIRQDIARAKASF